jgi:hypothetical protein
VRENLIDELALRRASLLDAAQEFADGELDAVSYEALREREEERIAQIEVELASLAPLDVAPATAPEKPRRRRRRSLLIVGLVSLALAAGGSAVLYASSRQPGDSASGSISASTQAQITRLLSEAEVDVATGNTNGALSAFYSVLLLEPRNVEALSQAGWLEFSAGSATQSLSLVRRGGEAPRSRRDGGADRRGRAALLGSGVGVNAGQRGQGPPTTATVPDAVAD